jgi:hypothetical protein
MTTLTITIECENAAFEGSARNAELYRILTELAEKLIDNGNDDLSEKLRDINGNTVGYANLLTM